MLLGRSPHSSALPGEILDRLARLGSVEYYQGGELIHAAWQPVHKLWVVLSGGLRVSLLCKNGGGLALAVLGEGSYYGAGSLVGNGEIEQSELHVLGPTELASFELAQLEHEFAGDSLMQQHRIALLHRLLSASVNLGRDLLAVPLPRRLARRLLAQALTSGRQRDIELRITQTDLAAMLGASRSKVNAELRRLETGGAVELGYRRIVVRDLEQLRAAAGADVMPL